jgi:hypothetical protein
VGTDACLALSNDLPADANWLPEDEGAQLRFEFESELARLKAA